MSRYIATRAIRGATSLVTEAEVMLRKALIEKGPDTPVAFPNTAYYLPLILGMTGEQVETLGQLQPVVKQARQLLHPVPLIINGHPTWARPSTAGWPPCWRLKPSRRCVLYMDCNRGDARLRVGWWDSFHQPGWRFRERFRRPLEWPIDDIQLRSWGIQLVDGRMPGFAAIVGAAKSNEVAVKIVRSCNGAIFCASSRATSTGAASSTS